jgi:hypothetical protein
MKIPTLLCLASVALALTITSASANLVTNSGFETGDFTGWSAGGFTGVDMSSAYAGDYGAYLGTTEVPSFISQDLTTTPGSIYDLSFFLQGFETKNTSHTNVVSGFESTFQVFWNGVMVLNLVNPDPFQYTQFNLTGLAATGAATNLQFVYSGGGLFFNLDNVAVNAAITAVPESLSSLWLVLPVAGMFLSLKRQERMA